MARTNLNDWNFMGDSFNASKNSERENVNSAGFTSVFLTALVVLVLAGIISVYSSSIGVFENSEITSETILFRQLVYVGVGIALFSCVAILPINVTRILSPILVLCVIGYNVYSIVNNPVFTQNSVSTILIFICTTQYYSSFFGRRNNKITRIMDLLAPILVAVIFTAILSKTTDFVTVALYILAVVVVFGICSVNFIASLLLFLFVLVPALCIVFSNPEMIEKLLEYIVPGIGSGINEGIQIRRQCISSGSIFGKGIAMGTFKLSGLEKISTVNIICNICEETGLLGSGFLSIAFIVLFLSSFWGSSVIDSKEMFKINLVNGMTVLLAFQVIVNALSVLGYFPENDVTLPLISFGPQIIPQLYMCGCIYRCLLREKKKRTEDLMEQPNLQEGNS